MKFIILKNNDTMKGRILFIKVKSGAATKRIDDVLYAGQTVSMSPRILFRGNHMIFEKKRGCLCDKIYHEEAKRKNRVWQLGEEEEDKNK